MLTAQTSQRKGTPMKTPITKKAIQTHFTYSSWKYMLLIVVAIFGWNLIYSTTEPQTPEYKKVVMGMYTYAETEELSAYMEQIRQDYMPDMIELTPQSITPDEMYGDMILSTRFAARECDIYILPRAQFQSYAAQGGFMPLEVVLPDLIADLEAAGISLSRGYRSVEETGEKHQFGIPCASMTFLQSTVLADMSDMYLCVFFYTENDENVLKFTDYFVRDMLAKSGVDIPTITAVETPAE